MELVFGCGSFWAVPSTDSNGVTITNPTPQKFGTMQDFTLNVEFTLKELTSRFQLPIAAARSAAKLSWTAKFAQINTGLYHSVFFGNTGQPTAGAFTAADTEAKTIPATPFGVATTNATTFIRDDGVRFSSNGNPLIAAVANPTTGQYVAAPTGAPDWKANTAYIAGDFVQPLTGNAGSFVYMATTTATSGGSAPTWTQTVGAAIAVGPPNWLSIGLKGNYLFAAADTGLGVWIDYIYQPTFGYRTTFTSQLLGNAPTFLVIARGVFLGAPMTIRLDNNVSNKLTFARKNDDWLIPEMSGEAFVGGQGSGNAGFIS